MNKSLLSICFSFILLAMVIAPTVVLAIDNSIDISLVYDISDEEEKKGKDNAKEFEKFVVDITANLEEFACLKRFEQLEYAFKNYPKPHLNLITPPPEFI